MAVSWRGMKQGRESTKEQRRICFSPEQLGRYSSTVWMGIIAMGQEEKRPKGSREEGKKGYPSTALIKYKASQSPVPITTSGYTIATILSEKDLRIM